MKYTYKNECIIADRGDVGSFVFLGIWIMITLAIFLADAHLIFVKGGDGIGSPVVGGMTGVVVVAAAVVIYRGIHKRRSRALAIRYKALSEGTRCDGVIVDAGRILESESYECEGDDGRTETRHVTRPNYWIDVQYTVPKTGEVRVFRAEHMHKSMTRFLDCGVDVYIRYEWCEVLLKESPLIYIDTCGLN